MKATVSLGQTVYSMQTFHTTMGYDLNKGRHSVYALQYHFVQCVKSWRKALVDPGVIDKLKEHIYNISQTFDVEVLNIETDKDHFHMIFKGHPTLELTKYINAIKTLTVLRKILFAADDAPE